jgi:hypothetical protein
MVSGLEMVTALIENALAGRTVQHVKTPPQLSVEQRRRIWGENVRGRDEDCASFTFSALSSDTLTDSDKTLLVTTGRTAGGAGTVRFIRLHAR